jgi:hypothetical protein
MKVFSRFGVVSCVLLLITSFAARSEEVWFAPPDNMDRGPRTYNHDFPDLFDAAPRWSVRADAFKLSPKFVAQASEGSIRHVTDFLTSHHIAIVADTGGVQMDSPTPVPGECGYGVEGYARPGRNQIVFNRWKRLGREVQYINFDEPLSFGHHYHGKNACNFSIQEVAKRTAVSIAEIRKSYPNAKIVDSEALATTEPGPQWVSDLQQWLTAYHQAVGEYPYAVIFDINWSRPWLPTVRAATDLLHRKGVRAGYFLDGAGPTDAAAVADLKKNMSDMDAAKVPLDIVMVANWTPHPANDLPESDTNSLSGALHDYMVKHGHTN